MPKPLLSFLLITICWLGCIQKQEAPKLISKKPSFSSFEISYHGGWVGGLAFRVDSNKIFIAPYSSPQNIDDTIKYGLLPDSLMQQIQNTLADTSIHSIHQPCDDCDRFSLISVMQKDTFRIVQDGDISDPVMKLIKSLSHFVNSSKQDFTHGLIILETTKDIASPPPPITH